MDDDNLYAKKIKKLVNFLIDFENNLPSLDNILINITNGAYNVQYESVEIFFELFVLFKYKQIKNIFINAHPLYYINKHNDEIELKIKNSENIIIPENVTKLILVHTVDMLNGYGHNNILIKPFCKNLPVTLKVLEFNINFSRQGKYHVDLLSFDENQKIPFGTEINLYFCDYFNFKNKISVNDIVCNYTNIIRIFHSKTIDITKKIMEKYNTSIITDVQASTHNLIHSFCGAKDESDEEYNRKLIF